MERSSVENVDISTCFLCTVCSWCFIISRSVCVLLKQPKAHILTAYISPLYAGYYSAIMALILTDTAPRGGEDEAA